MSSVNLPPGIIVQEKLFLSERVLIIMAKNIATMRNIGISAHIDSGKTTLTERILYYCNKIHAIHEVKGKDGVGATMDSMELERERGITICSAATNVEWKDHQINIIDTPGHVDFTIEVERALRVLDGAILVLCSVGGVQSQSITVDRQLKRYNVPRLAFINKCDRSGADPFRVKDQLREKLGHNAVMVQIPIGLEEKLEGVVDLVSMKAYYFDGKSGDDIRIEDIPADLKSQAKEYRDIMLDALSMYSDELAEAYLEGKETEEMIRKAIRIGTLSLDLTPVFCGSAYKNKAIQLLLDGVISYLPNPSEIDYRALDKDKNGEEFKIIPKDDAPPIALAFKLEDGQYGQLTYVRIYQGSIRKGSELENTRNGKRFKVGRLIRMHANSTEDITEAGCGDIIALFGVDCASGDTFAQEGMNVTMTSMYVPEPVISLAIKPIDKKSADNMSKALNRFVKEDPTFRSYVDAESNETIIRGMGELHLEIYIERMKREYKVELETGMPQVAYRETITQVSKFDYTHKKQTGGSGQFGRVAGVMEPFAEKDYLFVDNIKGGVIPNEFIPSCDKGFKQCLPKGRIIGFPIVGVKVTIDDGSFHAVDSSDIAFQQAAIGGFWQAFDKAKPEILEPIMKVAVEGPTEFQGNILGSLNQRRGVIIATTEESKFTRVEADVPLSEMFGYSTILRSLTQGKAEFSMEFLKYGKVPMSIAEQLKKDFQDQKKLDSKKK
jgi:elongation factor G